MTPVGIRLTILKVHLLLVYVGTAAIRLLPGSVPEDSGVDGLNQDCCFSTGAHVQLVPEEGFHKEFEMKC